jgi:N-ethylmaleimide reductase
MCQYLSTLELCACDCDGVGWDVEFVASLGADIDYKASRFEDSAKGVDVVFDTVDGEPLERSWGVLGPRGRLMTIVSSAENTT